LSSERGVHVCGPSWTGLRFVKYYRHHHASEPPAHGAAFAVGFLLPFLIMLVIAMAIVR